MKLVSMENDPAAMRAARRGARAAPDADDTPPKYPAGLRLCIEDDQLDRLGLDEVAVGDVLTIEAHVKVVAYSESADDDDDGAIACRLELQITDLGVAGDESAARARRDDQRLDELGGNS
jgi:hypothetical protein